MPQTAHRQKGIKQKLIQHWKHHSNIRISFGLQSDNLKQCKVTVVPSLISALLAFVCLLCNQSAKWFVVFLHVHFKYSSLQLFRMLIIAEKKRRPPQQQCVCGRLYILSSFSPLTDGVKRILWFTCLCEGVHTWGDESFGRKRTTGCGPRALWPEDSSAESGFVYNK